MRRWRIMSILVVIGVLGTALPASAHPACSCDGSGTACYRRVVSDQLTGETHPCAHGLDGEDAEKSRVIAYEYTDGDCGLRWRRTEREERYWVCRGYAD